MINMLLTASVTGGIVILLWYLSYPFSKKYFKASWHYAVLKITMIFMLVPIGIFAPMLNSVFAGIFKQPELPYISEQIQKISIDGETINSVNTAVSNFVFSDVQPVQHSPSPQVPQTTKDNINSHQENIIDDIKSAIPKIPYLQIIWLIVAAILFSNGLRKMHKFKKQILISSNGNVDRETQELFTQCREQLKVRGRITLRTSEYIKTPFVFGLIKTLIIFPETDMSADEKRLAFIHEFTHIKNGDLWLKFFACVISAVHWFNPFAHLLYRKISDVSEEYCDERIVKTMTKDEKFLYGDLILKVVTGIGITKPQSRFCSTLSAPTKNIKRRLFNMINTQKSRRSMIALSVLAALILCSFATIYALAANPDIPEIPTPDLPEVLIAEPEKNINDDFKFEELYEGSLGIGYVDGNGEETYRYSPDGGFTWYTDDDIPDPDISAIEWLTYDENGYGKTAKIIIGDDEIEFTFNFSEPYYAITIGDGETYTMNSQEEIDEWLAKYESIADETLKGYENYYEDECLNLVSYETYAYRYVSEDGENIFGFGGDTIQSLYEVVKEHFDKWIQEEKMTQEEADRKLAEIRTNLTRAMTASEYH